MVDGREKKDKEKEERGKGEEREVGDVRWKRRSQLLFFFYLAVDRK